MNRPLALGLLALPAGLLLLGSSPAPTPPVAPRKDHAQVWHGRTFVDPYYWLREKGSPDVVKYLEAENAYTEATTADLKPFSEALYAEMLGRIKQTDLSVPTRDGRLLLLPPHGRGPAVPDPLSQAGGTGRSPQPVGSGRSAPRPERDGEGPRVPLRGQVRSERRWRAAPVLDRRHRVPSVQAVRQGPEDRRRAGTAGRARDERNVGGRQPDPVLRDRAPGDEALGHPVAPGARRPAAEGARGDGRALRDRGREDQGQEVRRARQPLDRHLGPSAAARRRPRAASFGSCCPERRATSTTSSTATAPSSSARTRTPGTSVWSRRRSTTHRPRAGSRSSSSGPTSSRRLRGLQGLRRGPGEAGRAQPPARPRLSPTAPGRRCRSPSPSTAPSPRGRRSSTRKPSATATRA